MSRVDTNPGLSSFAYLKLFPVDTLKIDGSFIRDVVSNHVSQSVVAAISELARVMQLETVAEYVQDKESLSLLKNIVAERELILLTGFQHTPVVLDV